MTDWMASFDDVATYWRPSTVHTVDVVDADRPTRLAALLDQPSPVVWDGDPLPCAWHVLLHLPMHPQASLGPDGHPRSDPLVPALPDGRRRVFGGGRLEVRSPLRCGDRVVRISDVTGTRATQGHSGPLLLVTVRHVLTVDDEARVVEEHDLIFRPPRSGPTAVAPQEAESAVASDAAPWSLTMRSDPVLLFRFSALTSNAHRIHYDRAYAQEIEGHHDLLVHGPLSALLLLELPRRVVPGRTVRHFCWRARRPAYVGQQLEVTGHPDGDAVKLSLQAGATRGVVTGTATLAPIRHGATP